MSDNVLKTANTYLYNSYRDTLKAQVFLADHNIFMDYTDTLSLSELDFLLDVVQEIDKMKNRDS